MVSLVDVTCPHCGAEGRIVLPPLGAIIFGPCPECAEMVAVFCGHTLPLDKEIMNRQKEEEKKDHLLEVLGVFLHERIEGLFGAQGDARQFVAAPADDAEAAQEANGEHAALLANAQAEDAASRRPISKEEIDTFKKIELRMLDDAQYFKTVFK